MKKNIWLAAGIAGMLLGYPFIDARAEVNVQISTSNSPSFVIDSAPNFIYLRTQGFSISVGSPYDIVYYGNYYYIYHNGRWYRASNYHGPWFIIVNNRLPYHIRRHRWEDIQRYRDIEYRRPDSRNNRYQLNDDRRRRVLDERNEANSRKLQDRQKKTINDRQIQEQHKTEVKSIKLQDQHEKNVNDRNVQDQHNTEVKSTTVQDHKKTEVRNIKVQTPQNRETRNINVQERQKTEVRSIKVQAPQNRETRSINVQERQKTEVKNTKVEERQNQGSKSMNREDQQNKEVKGNDRNNNNNDNRQNKGEKRN